MERVPFGCGLRSCPIRTAVRAAQKVDQMVKLWYPRAPARTRSGVRFGAGWR